MEIKYTDIEERKEFAFQGDTLRLKECVNTERHIYIFERYNKNNELYAYEVVKGVKHKNPDGNIVYSYPGSESFGSHGFFIAKHNADKKRYGIQYCIDVLSGQIKEDWI
jgi:hypothetical protein